MRPLVVLPIALLAVLTALALYALGREVPFQQQIDSLPPDPVLAPPALGVGAASLVGRLLDPRGEPLEGASLSTLQRGRPLWTYTGADGVFRLDEVDEGPLEISVVARGHAAQVFRTVAGRGPVELRVAATLDPPPSLPDPPTSDLVGQIALPLAPDERADYEVVLVPDATPDTFGVGVPRRARTDGDGTFRIEDLVHGDYRVRLLPPWAAGGSWPNLLAPWQDPAPLLTHPAADGPPRLESIAGALAGVALERTRPGTDPAPVEGALVLVSPLGVGADGHPDPHPFPGEQSGPDGAWQVRHLPPGRYRVTLAAGTDRREAVVTVRAGARVDPGF
jgi:hypothetical protein